MLDFHEKRKIRSYIYSPVVVIVLVILSVILSVSVFERFKVEREMAERRAETEERLEELRLRAAALEGKVEHLENDRGIEEEIRTRFDVAKEGEQVVIIVDESEDGVPLEELSRPPGSGSEDEEGWFRRFIPWF
jgi:cell division protein FtsB